MNTHLYTFETLKEAKAAFEAECPTDARNHPDWLRYKTGDEEHMFYAVDSMDTAYNLAGLEFKSATFHESLPQDAAHYLLSRVR